MHEGAARTVESAVEFFPALTALGFVRHAFIGRIPGIDVVTDRAQALARLDAAHTKLRAKSGFDGRFATAEQVHGDRVAVAGNVDLSRGATEDIPAHAAAAQTATIPGVDGLLTNERKLSLGIYVADCAAVFLVDPVQRAIGLVHSGRKGTELRIVPKAVSQMQERFGSAPGDLVAQLSPCIRPPHYEIDFAAEIIRQLHRAGVRQVHDPGVCTACEPARYYSYRAEKGRTGRMLALLALT